MPLDGEKKNVRCHLINCILVHAKVAIVSKKRVAYENNSATICSRAQNRVQVDAPTIEESVPENLGNRSGLKRNLAPGLSTWPSVIVSNVS